jgi:hypothetical protein
MEEYTKSEFRKIKIVTGEKYIKVSELKAWCERGIEDYKHHMISQDELAIYQMCLNKFCKDGHE